MAGVSGRKPVRRVGDLLEVVTMTKKRMAKKRKDPATASETVLHPGGSHLNKCKERE